MELGGPILVVDDDAACRELVSTILERVGYPVREAATGASALAAAREERPALVVLDVELPMVSGYQVCRELRDTYGSELPVVFLSGARTEPYDRAGGLLLGADDYVVKPFDGDELLARIRRLVGQRPSNGAGDHRAAGSLTAREREVLSLLAEGLEQVEIGRRLFITPKTVATHIQRILAKLGVHSRAQAVAMAHRDQLVVASNGNGRS